MDFNIDGFNERNIYIANSNDKANSERNGVKKFDNSFAKMRMEEHKNVVETANNDLNYSFEKPKETLQSFRLKNSFKNISSNDSLNNALNRNRFK